VPALYIRAAINYGAESEQVERYPGLDVAYVDCAHFVQLEKPEETNALVEKLLAQVTEGALA
jgi:pimeloyl-ACP methyl ester carboxylesterase